MPSRLNKTQNLGFTLLEILLVVGIIAILAGIVILAINPGKQLATVRNLQRKSNLAEINKALYQYYISNSSYPVGVTTTLLEICNTGATSTGHSLDCTNKADLSSLVPTYLVSIPTDPLMTGTSTRYKVMKDPGNKIVLTAPQAELGLPVSIGNWCLSPITDTRDSTVYTTIAIGNQCWMQQNLNIGTKVPSCTGGYVSGTNACTVGGDTVHDQGTSTTSIEKYCYLDTEDNCTTYGGLYQWSQAMGGSTTTGATGICPTGFHIPTDTEYKTLEVALGMCTGTGTNPNYCVDDGSQWRGTTQGDQLKNTGLCGGRTPCGTSNFKGLLAGYRSTGGSFSYLTGSADLWSSLESGASAWKRNLYSGNATVYRSTSSKANGFSVRCLKD